MQKNRVKALYQDWKSLKLGNRFRGFLRKCQSIFGQGPKGAGELKRLVLPSSRRQWEQTHSDHLTPRSWRDAVIIMHAKRSTRRLKHSLKTLYLKQQVSSPCKKHTSSASFSISCIIKCVRGTIVWHFKNVRWGKLCLSCSSGELWRVECSMSLSFHYGISGKCFVSLDWNKLHARNRKVFKRI